MGLCRDKMIVNILYLYNPSKQWKSVNYIFYIQTLLRVFFHHYH